MGVSSLVSSSCQPSTMLGMPSSLAQSWSPWVTSSSIVATPWGTRDSQAESWVTNQHCICGAAQHVADLLQVSHRGCTGRADAGDAPIHAHGCRCCYVTPAPLSVPDRVGRQGGCKTHALREGDQVGKEGRQCALRALDSVVVVRLQDA